MRARTHVSNISRPEHVPAATITLIIPENVFVAGNYISPTPNMAELRLCNCCSQRRCICNLGGLLDNVDELDWKNAMLFTIAALVVASCITCCCRK